MARTGRPKKKTPPERTLQLKILISPEEKQWLEEIAEAKGLNVSTVVRQWIRAERIGASGSPASTMDPERALLHAAITKLLMK